MNELTHRKTNINRYRAIIFSLFVLVLAFLSFHGALDNFAHEHVTDTTAKSIGIYAVSRGINAVISVLQSSEVSFLVSVQIGELLDPVNDAVEKLSSAMVWAIGSLFLQRIILEMASSSLFKWVFFVTSILAVVVTLLGQWERSRKFLFTNMQIFYDDLDNFQHVLVRIFAITGIVRFVVPAFVAVGFFVSGAFLKPAIDENTAKLSNFSAEVSQIQKQLVDEQKNELQGLNDRTAREQSVEEPTGPDSMHDEQKERHQDLTAQKNQMEAELRALRSSLYLLQQNFKELDASIDKIVSSGSLGMLPDWIRKRLDDAPDNEVETLRSSRDAVRHNIVLTNEQIEERKSELECIELLLAGEDCDSLFDKASDVVLSTKEVASETISNVTDAVSETWSTATNAMTQMVSKVSMARFSRITALVEKTNDIVTIMANLLIVVVVENIVLPIIFLMIAIKGSLPVARTVARMTPTLRQDSRQLRDNLGRTE